MIDIKVEVRGTQVVANGLNKLAADLRRGAIKEIAEAVLVSMDRRIEKSGLDERDRRILPSRRVKLHGGITLLDKGSMLTAMRVLSATATRAVIGFGSARENNKAWWHQHGTTRKSGRQGLPARPFFGISPTDEKNAQLAADSFLARVARESGL